MAGVNLHLPLYKPNPTRSSSSHTPSAYTTRTTDLITIPQNLAYWESIHTDIDSHLKKSIQIREPISVFEPMHHFTFTPPKTTASALCVAACEVVGGNREDAVVAASAIHLMYASIYTHNLLLETVRVGSESGPGIENLHKFGSNIELLTSDGIVPFAFELLAGSGNDSGRTLQVVIEIAKAVGAQGMVAGEDDGVEAEKLGGEVARQLHGCGAACGAIMGGGTLEEIERLKRYGVYVGKIEGVLSDEGKDEGVKVELVERLRGLALKELECFDGKKIQQISSIVGV
ncbi:hypothetical protein QVD17_14089 [Tagetes erecta]|uniref:Uncharacterized protein n=1 Tax=Tagetes erecta TaxID=13708 RepID=A0AAD8KWI4_TARER|nr:hypothetical protein QVD17_14089 [Tagetes erecta]